MELGKARGEAVIVAGIGSRKGVSAAEVIAAVEAALNEHGLERGTLTKLATTGFKRGEAGIFEAGEMMGLEVVVVEIPPPLTPPAHGVAAAPEKVDPHSGLLRKPPLPRSTGERKAGGTVWRLSSTPRSGGEVARPELVEGRDGVGAFAGISGSASVKEDGDASSAPTRSSLSLQMAGVESVSESAALAAAGEGARLVGPRLAVGRVTCAIAFGGGR